MKFKIEDVEFEFKEIKIQSEKFGGILPFSSRQRIEIITETSNQNYMKLDMIFNHVSNVGGVKNYKKDLIFNTIRLIGMFPHDYCFLQNCIQVTFSVDHFVGDLNLFKQQEVRRAKLKKIENSNK
jgi:hypothetical protein